MVCEFRAQFAPLGRGSGQKRLLLSVSSRDYSTKDLELKKILKPSGKNLWLLWLFGDRLGSLVPLGQEKLITSAF